MVVSVNPLPSYRTRLLREGAAVMSFLPVNSSHDLVTDLRDRGVTSFAMELVPRISRAQSMDALSSQALVAGYRCAIVAAGLLRRFFPLNMTAAGTVQAAQVVVLGAGVAGSAGDRDREEARRRRAGVRRACGRCRGDPVDGSQVDRPRPRDPRGKRWLCPRDDRGPGRAAKRAARAVHRRRRRPDHHRRGSGSAGADARHRRHGQADEARLRRGRSRRRVRRQRRGLGGRKGRADRPRAGVGRRERAGPDARAGIEALRPERGQPADADDARGRVRPGLRRRGRHRRRGDPRRPDRPRAHARGDRGPHGGRGPRRGPGPGRTGRSDRSDRGLRTEPNEPEPNESEPEREQATQQLDLPFDQEEQK